MYMPVGAFFLLLVAILAVLVPVIGFGCLYSHRAGRGSANALAAWIVFAAAEVVMQFLGLAWIAEAGFNFVLLVPAAALAVQVGLYVAGRWSD